QKEPRWFLQHIHHLLHRLERIEDRKPAQATILAEAEQHALLEDVEETTRKTTTPLQRWESGLEQPVALFVLPIF
ncbi:MAG: Na+/H+ antiporter NhaA, partial [Gammaproteobacteria bacterium]|nr:Na+/H+ antiporter NhaA [Gammaproteobacteria bacterium]NIR96367.1 Na+/H+ antiporter NhaA [Gammaproteobacteria bacterium]NIW47993.1 sodium:proton antiporter [Gammaproteobacteria bacterium]